MSRPFLAVIGLWMLTLGACRGPQLRTGSYELRWTPLEERDGELVLREVEVRPRPGARVERLTVELRGADGAVLERIDAEPVPEDASVLVGDLRARLAGGLSVVILVTHDGSATPGRVELRP